MCGPRSPEWLGRTLLVVVAVMTVLNGAAALYIAMDVLSMLASKTGYIFDRAHPCFSGRGAVEMVVVDGVRVAVTAACVACCFLLSHRPCAAIAMNVAGLAFTARVVGLIDCGAL